MLNLENTGLIVVDIQGKLAKLVADSEATISHCQKLIKGAKALVCQSSGLNKTPKSWVIPCLKSPNC